jgi:large subunit ribosomal protein L5
MYEFLDRLVNVSLPRVRDFHGVSATAFDKAGNYNLGIVEQSIFPELTFEETQVTHGLQVTMVIAGGDKVKSRALLEKFGIPFEKEGGKR